MKCPINPKHKIIKNLQSGQEHCQVCGDSIKNLDGNEDLFQKVLFDPPSGWMYGFPRRVPIEINSPESLKQWMLDCGYPEKDIEFASKHGRWIHKD